MIATRKRKRFPLLRMIASATPGWLLGSFLAAIGVQLLFPEMDCSGCSGNYVQGIGLMALGGIMILGTYWVTLEYLWLYRGDS